jgi:hypothetical protein
MKNMTNENLTCAVYVAVASTTTTFLYYFYLAMKGTNQLDSSTEILQIPNKSPIEVPEIITVDSENLSQLIFETQTSPLLLFFFSIINFLPVVMSKILMQLSELFRRPAQVVISPHMLSCARIEKQCILLLTTRVPAYP